MKLITTFFAALFGLTSCSVQKQEEKKSKAGGESVGTINEITYD